MSKPTHIKTIEKRRKRRAKLKKLREKYLLAKTKEEKEKILEKVRKITPWLSEEEFLAPLKRG
jgi:hypothetical protein